MPIDATHVHGFTMFPAPGAGAGVPMYPVPTPCGSGCWAVIVLPSNERDSDTLPAYNADPAARKASVLQRKIRLVAIEDTQPTIDPIFEQSDSIVRHALALAEFHRKHNGAGYALDMLQPLLDYAEQIRAEAMLQAASMEAFNPMSPDIDI